MRVSEDEENGMWMAMLPISIGIYIRKGIAHC